MSDAPVRFREDTGYEFRCPSCLSWWPLTDEFWYPRRGMTRCLACHRSADARSKRERFLRETTARERHNAAMRRYRLRLRRKTQRAA